MQADAFTVHFGDDLSDQERVKFYLKMENANYTFIDSIMVSVKAPILKYGALSITDTEGNPMDRLMKGTSSYLTFDLKNQGGSKSMEIRNTLCLLAPFISVDETEATIPAIEAGATGQVTFLAHVDDDAADGVINYNIQAESGHYNDLTERQIPLGYTSEDFEGETLNENIQWRLGTGNKLWSIIEDETAHGGHCLRSPTINSGNSTLFVGITTEVDDKVTFYRKTHTEGSSTLTVSLNSVELNHWSGDSDWELTEFALPAGDNLIRFVYKKDASGGADEVVMIDDICFPPLANMVIYAGDDTEACPNATFTPKSYIYNHKNLSWSTSGDGTFDDITAEQPSYTFGEGDKATGQVELTLTGTNAINEIQQSSTIAVSLLPSIDESYLPATPNGATEVDLRILSQSDYTGETISDVIYTWTIEPATAGNIVAEGAQARVDWGSDYRGEATISYWFENPCGATSASEPLKVNVFNSTGADEHQVERVEVYPNPAKDKICVRTHREGIDALRIFDLSGKVVYESVPSTGSETAVIETSKLGGSGLYTLQVVQKGNITNVRFVVTP